MEPNQTTEMYPITDEQIHNATSEHLTYWSGNLQYSNRAECLAELARRAEVRKIEATERRDAILVNPFDPRTEVSADAKHIAGRIVTHLWILFVLLPIIAVVLLLITGAIR